MRDVRVDLERIVMCAERVIEYTDGSSFDEFVVNDLRYDATLRNLEIMGEAAERVPESIRARFLGVPWRDLTGFRDRLAHADDALDDRVVWDAVQRSVPETLVAVRAALNDLGRRCRSSACRVTSLPREPITVGDIPLYPSSRTLPA